LSWGITGNRHGAEERSINEDSNGTSEPWRCVNADR
jgi:hypothetical protein